MYVLFLFDWSRAIRSRRGHGLLDIPTLRLHQITALSPDRRISAGGPPAWRITSYRLSHAK
jgi:hypothetical protein